MIMSRIYGGHFRRWEVTGGVGVHICHEGRGGSFEKWRNKDKEILHYTMPGWYFDQTLRNKSNT